MDQKKREKIAWILAIVLTPIFIYLIVTNVSQARKRRAARPPRSGVSVSPGQPSGPAAVALVNHPDKQGLDPEVLAEQQRISEGEPSRNPFIAAKSDVVPLTRKQVENGFSYKVSAIILSPGSNKRMAMINGKMFEEGDRIGEWTVLQVGAREVVFDNGVQRKTVSVK